MSYFDINNKKMFFEEIGEGKPLFFLHGNTASSKMFTNIIDLYKNNYKVILVDFLGHGQSERLEKFPIDLWFDEAMQVIEFLDDKKYDKVDIIGSNGGALVALNIALERPDLVNKVIADSFEGEVPLLSFVENIVQDRSDSKEDAGARGFYTFCHEDNWEQVVDNDTHALYEHSKEIKRFFHKPLGDLQVSVLMTGSREDEFVAYDFYEKTYTDILNKVHNGEMYLFNKGGHPAILSNAIEFSKIAERFLSK